MRFKLILLISSLFLFILQLNGQKLNNNSWKFTKGFCAQGNTMVQCAGNGWGRAGYVSKSVLKSNEDGRIDITVSEINKYHMIGLGRNSTSGHYSHIDYALYISKNRLTIYENGRYKAKISNLSSGHKLAIVKKGNKIQYLHNGRVVYSSRTSVNKDLQISASAYSNGTRIPEITSSFEKKPQELYTKNEMSSLSSSIKWHGKHQYTYSSDLSQVVTTGDRNVLLSENYLDINNNEQIIITPNLNSFFTKSSIGRRVNATVGIKRYKEGDFINRELSIHDVNFGISFERTSRGENKTFIVDEGRIVGELPNFNEKTEVRLRTKSTTVFLEMKFGGRYKVVYEKEIEYDGVEDKYIVFQGANHRDNPLIEVQATGLSTVKNYNLGFELNGEEDLLAKYDNNIEDVLSETGQNKIGHVLSWTNLSNVKRGTEHSVITGKLEAIKELGYGYAESAEMFSPKDEFALDFKYDGGEFEIGFKAMFQGGQNIVNGISVNSGQLQFINGGNSAPISTGSTLSLSSNGNGALNVNVNGNSVGQISLPNSLFSVQANVASVLSSNVTISGWSSNPFVVLGFSNYFNVHQFNYDSDCGNAVNNQIYLKGVSLPAPFNNTVTIGQYAIRNVNTNAIIYSSGNISVSGNSPFTANHSLKIGLYRFESWSFGNKYFEVSTPTKWSDIGPGTNAVTFDAMAFNNSNSVSKLKMTHSSAKSVSENILEPGKSGTFSFPHRNENKGAFGLKLSDVTNSLNASVFSIINQVGVFSPSELSVVQDPNASFSIAMMNALQSNTSEIKVRIIRDGNTASIYYIEDYNTTQNERIVYQHTINWPNSKPIKLSVQASFPIPLPSTIIQAKSTFCPTPPPVALDLDPESFGFAIMKRKYDNNYYVAKDGELRFSFEENYFVGTTNQLNYRIYNEFSDEITSNCSSTFPIKMGENRYLLDVVGNCSSFQLNKQYKLEISNSKGEKRFLRFLYTD